MKRLYCDHAATTPLSAAAREAMLPWLDCGNPSSLAAEGRRAKDAIDQARESVSGALGCLFAEVAFTASGSEAANLALLGSALGNPDPARRRILVGASEHHCVLHAAPALARLGYRVEELPVDRYARIDPAASFDRLGDDVLLVAAMHANNEFGTIQPVREWADRIHACGALLFVDAVQTFLAWPWRVDDLGADLVAISAHKVNGPKGAGALYVRAGTALKAVIAGGGQERELRAGTENVAAIVGFGAAVRSQPEADRRSECREAFWAALPTGDWVRTVPPDIACLPGHAHLRFPGVSAQTALILLDRMGVAASSGAACSAGSVEPSHVLLAAGYSLAEAAEGLRFTFGKADDPADAAEAARRLAQVVERIRRA